MAGFRDFQTGEVLTAANVNDFLAKQAVMKFADAAARDTALGTAVGGSNALREGMVAYLDDTDEVISYDGTSWASVGGKILQVVTAADTTQRTTTSPTYTDTGLSVTITPRKSTSAIIVVFTGRFRSTDRGSLAITDSSDNEISGAEGLAFFEAGVVNFRVYVTMVGYDTPATTSATTYKARFGNADSSSTVLENNQTAARMYAIEVAA